MMLIQLACFPEGHLEATRLSILLLIIIRLRSIFKHALLNALTGLIGRSKVRSIQLSLPLICQDLIV